MKIDYRCRDAACGVPMSPGSVRPTPPGTRRHAGRGLCSRCYHRHTVAGTLPTFPVHTHRREDLYEDWTELQALGLNLREAAARLRVSVDALEQAIHRTRRGGYRPATRRGPRRGHDEIVRQWRELTTQGMSTRQALLRMGACRKTLNRALARAGEGH